MIDEERFGGVTRLYGRENAGKLATARIAVVGIGGVGSWAAEALARSGVGCVILQDMDDICITNTNRQIHALQGSYGQLKTDAMAARMRLINPAITIETIPCFYSAAHPEPLFNACPDVVIDAIDSMRPKTHLVAECHKRGVPIVTCGGAGGRIDASRISIADLARACGDNMLARLRKNLRQDYGFPLYDRCPEIGIPCVYSPERPRFPKCDGTVSCEREPGQKGGIGCASGFGSAAHVTGTFGLMAAGAALNFIAAR